MLNAECFVMAQSSAESNHRVRFRKQTSKQENTTSLNVFPINSHYYYVFFFLNHNVVDVLFERLYLENYYLLLVWAAQSMFPIVANVTSATAGREAGREARGQAQPGERGGCGGRLCHPLLRLAPLCNNLFQSF